jgi:uncharacterized protein
VLPVQIGLLVAGGVLLLAIGAALLGRAAALKRLEPAGVWLWRRIAPHAGRLLPPRSRKQAVAAGLLWGWIPCGMVYAALPLALVAGGPLAGALVMLAFGLGTLPNLLALHWAAGRAIRSGVAAAGQRTRRVLAASAGAIVLAFGASNLAHAARIAGAQHPAVAAIASLCHR